MQSYCFNSSKTMTVWHLTERNMFVFSLSFFWLFAYRVPSGNLCFLNIALWSNELEPKSFHETMAYNDTSNNPYFVGGGIYIYKNSN